jgi:hypothetical protein
MPATSETDRQIINAYEMQRLIGRRLKRTLQGIVEEKLPDDIAAVLCQLEERASAQGQESCDMH